MTVGGSGNICATHMRYIYPSFYYVNYLAKATKKLLRIRQKGGNMSDTHASYSSIFFITSTTVIKYIIPI